MVSTKNEVILNDKFVELTFDSENKIVTAKWIGFLKLDETKKACATLVQFVRTNQVTRHLSDQTQLKVLSKEVQEFLAGECLPELEKVSLRKLAVLVSDDIFAQAAVNNVNTKAKMGKLSINTYNSKPQCIAWLTE